MEKVLDWLKKFFTGKTFKVILIKFFIYSIIYVVILYYMFEIFWDESLMDVISK